MATATTTTIAIAVLLRASSAASFVLLPSASVFTGDALSIHDDIAATSPRASRSLQGSDEELAEGTAITWDGKDPTEAVEVVDAERHDAPVGVVCHTDIRECPDSGGIVVERDPDNGCNFYPCPAVDEETGAVDLDNETGEVVDEVVNEDDDVSVEAVGELEEEMLLNMSGAVDEKADAAAAEEEMLLQLNGDEGLLAVVDENDLGGESSSNNFSSGGGASSSSSSSSSATSVESNNTDVFDGRRSAWVAHGTIGALVFGLLVPLAISSAFFRKQIGDYWVFLHVGLNTLSLLLTIVAVSLAFVTMNGAIAAEGGRHMDERHHVAGLLLLLLVAFQNVNGFLRPPKAAAVSVSAPDPWESHRAPATADDDNGASLVPTVRKLWYSVHVAIGFSVFVLGSYQVTSGLGLFAERFGAADRGPAYLAYVFILVVAILGVKAAGVVRMQSKKKKKAKSEEEMSAAVFQLPGVVNNLTSSGRRAAASQSIISSSMVSARWDEFSVNIDGAA